MCKIDEKYKPYLSEGTSLHIIVTTLRCNMNCVYCQAASKEPGCMQYDMDIPTAKRTVEFIFQTPSNNITIEFQGGEPTLNFKIIKYVRAYAEKLNQFHNKNIEFLLVTNLNNMDHKKMEYLIDNNIKICTSLDGHKELHDKNRPLFNKSGSFDSTIKWIKEFNLSYRDKGLIHNGVSALLTVSKESLPYPIQIIDTYIKNGFTGIHVRPLTNLGCAAEEWDKIGYTPEEFIEFWRKTLDYIIACNKQGIDIQERLTTIMLRKIKGFPTNYMDLRIPCGAVIGQLAYNYDGSIFSCDEGRMYDKDTFKVGTVKDTYSQVVGSKKACKFICSSINNVHPCTKCPYKDYCGLCFVCTYEEQGELIGDIEKTPRCKIYKAMFDYIIKLYYSDVEIKDIIDKWVSW